MRPALQYVQVPMNSNYFQTQQQPNYQQVRQQDYQLARQQQAENDPRHFSKPVRINYEQCLECGLNKEKNNICLSTKCDYFQLVCPYCHPRYHKIDVKLTYQYQDLDLFLQDIIKMTQEKAAFAKQELNKGELHKLIDQRINQLDLVAAQIEQLKSVLTLKKQNLSNVFNDYDVVYKELQQLYGAGYNKSLTKTLELLKEKLLFKKGSNSKQWELGWKNEEGIFENYFRPIQEQKGYNIQGVTQNQLGGQQQRQQKHQPSVIQEVDEDQSSLSSSSGGRGRIELQRFREPLNNAIDKIEIAVNQMQKIAGELLQSQHYKFLVENQATTQMVNEEKEKCVRECNKILKQSQIHFQWESYEQMKTPSTSPSSIVAQFCAIFLTRPYSEDEGEEIPKPNLEKMFEVFLKAKDSIKKLEQFESKNYIYANGQQRKQ